MHANEQTLTVLGFRIPLIDVYAGWGFWPHEGEPVSVSFDSARVIKYRKWLLGFWHTHPNMFNSPSGIDNATMSAWCNVIGRPLFCMIEGLDDEVAGQMNLRPSDTPILIGNYLFKTYPRENKHDERHYVGHAHRIGKLFIWRKEV